jgi:hypothetical protein
MKKEKRWCYHRLVSPWADFNHDGLVDFIVESSVGLQIDEDKDTETEDLCAGKWGETLGPDIVSLRKAVLWHYFNDGIWDEEDLFLENELWWILEGDIKNGAEAIMHLDSEYSVPYMSAWMELFLRMDPELDESELDADRMIGMLEDSFYDDDWNIWRPSPDAIVTERKRLAKFADYDVLKAIPELQNRWGTLHAFRGKWATPQLSKDPDEAPQKDLDKSGIVYVIGNGGPPYKIGYTKSDARKRLTSIQIGNHQRLSIVREWHHESARALEKQMHSALASSRQSGEWFGCGLDAIDAAFSSLSRVTLAQSS